MDREASKDRYCSGCSEKYLCSFFLGVKKLEEYDDTDKTKYPSKIEWEENTPIIVTLTKHPFLGEKIESNIIFSSIPENIKNKIITWSKDEKTKSKLKQLTDYKGVTRTFGT